MYHKGSRKFVARNRVSKDDGSGRMKEKKERLITDDGLVENRQAIQTKIFIAVCRILTVLLILAGITALVK